MLSAFGLITSKSEIFLNSLISKSSYSLKNKRIANPPKNTTFLFIRVSRTV